MKIFENFEFRKKNPIKNETKILKNLNYAIFFIINHVFYVKLECRMFSVFIWYTYCPCRTKIDEFSKIVVSKVRKISAVEIGYFGATLPQNYAT